MENIVNHAILVTAAFPENALVGTAITNKSGVTKSTKELPNRLIISGGYRIIPAVVYSKPTTLSNRGCHITIVETRNQKE